MEVKSKVSVRYKIEWKRLAIQEWEGNMELWLPEGAIVIGTEVVEYSIDKDYDSEQYKKVRYLLYLVPRCSYY